MKYKDFKVIKKRYFYVNNFYPRHQWGECAVITMNKSSAHVRMLKRPGEKLWVKASSISELVNLSKHQIAQIKIKYPEYEI